MTDTTPRADAARVCPNCGGEASGSYCPRCGPKQTERLVSARRMIADLLEDNFSLEARLPRTLVTLLFRPGRLTRDYFAGRIARYVQPVRLYVAASLLFFLMLPLLADFDRLWGAIGPRAESAGEDQYVLVSVPIDSAAVPGWMRPPVRAWMRQEAKLNAMERREGARVLWGATIGAVPPVLFLLVPGFALVLKLLYRRRLYTEHFIFVLHFHALVFLLAALAVLVREDWMTALVALALAAWLFIALRSVYGREERAEPSGKTAFKYLLLLASYFVSLAVTIVLVTIAAVMLV